LLSNERLDSEFSAPARQLSMDDFFRNLHIRRQSANCSWAPYELEP